MAERANEAPLPGAMYRKVALEKLSTPEQLDQLVRITTPRGWLALIALGCLIAAALVWSFVGTIATRVKANGVIIRRGGTFNVVATNAGRIVELNVPPEHVVTKGQVIARVAQPELAALVIAARKELADLTAQRESLVSVTDADLQAGREELERQRSFLTKDRAAAERRRRSLEESAATTADLDAIHRDLLKIDHDLAALPSRQRLLENERRAELQRSELAIGAAQRTLEALQTQLASAETIVSPIDGHVLSLQAAVGDLVQAGTVLCNVELAHDDLIATVYVSPMDGRKIAINAPVQLAPAEVKQEEYGFMLGRVTRVSKFPTTASEMMYLLQNDGLVKLFSSHGAPYAVEVELLRDPKNPGGFRWSSERGPAVSITSGAVCTARIVVSRRHPIEMMIPHLRERLGL